MRAVANRQPMESLDDDRTTVMSRGLLPFPKRRAAEASEERTMVDVPRPSSSRPAPIAQIEERTTIGQTFPKSSAKLSTPQPTFGRSTLLFGNSPKPTPPRPMPVTRSTPPPMPLVRAGRDSKTMVAAPRTIPPPPPSATKLHHDMVERRSDIPSEPPSASVFVRDALPSSPSYSGATPRPRRDPMLLIAAGFGMLGMIFTLGIVCGLVVSLRGKAAPDTTAEQSAPIVFAAAASAPKVDAPIAPVAAAPAPVAAAPIASEPVAAKIEKIEKVAKIEIPKPQAPKLAVAKVAPWTAPASDSPRVARALTAAAAPKPAAVATKKRVAMPSDPDFDAANAANDLARAQLEASLH